MKSPYWPGWIPSQSGVAPCAGAGIEKSNKNNSENRARVAPCAGAGIETFPKTFEILRSLCRPLRGGGD